MRKSVCLFLSITLCAFTQAAEIITTRDRAPFPFILHQGDQERKCFVMSIPAEHTAMGLDRTVVWCEGEKANAIIFTHAAQALITQQLTTQRVDLLVPENMFESFHDCVAAVDRACQSLGDRVGRADFPLFVQTSSPPRCEGACVNGKHVELSFPVPAVSPDEGSDGN